MPNSHRSNLGHADLNVKTFHVQVLTYSHLWVTVLRCSLINQHIDTIYMIRLSKYQMIFNLRIYYQYSLKYKALHFGLGHFERGEFQYVSYYGIMTCTHIRIVLRDLLSMHTVNCI